MGYNTTVLVMNDSLGAIAADKEFGRKLEIAVQQVQSGRPIDISSQGHCNAATVIETHHADHTIVAAIGGNYGTVLCRSWGYRHHLQEDKVQLLKTLAEECGYRLVKKAGR